MLNKVRRSAGVTLVELIVALVIVGVALAGMVAVYTTTTRASADPVVVQQMAAIADNLMEEVLMKPFAKPVGNAPSNGARINFDNVLDYNGYDTKAQGISDVEGTPIPGLERYEVGVAVDTTATLPNVPSGQAMLVTVTVTDLRAAADAPGRTLVLTGWRTNPS